MTNFMCAPCEEVTQLLLIHPYKSVGFHRIRIIYTNLWNSIRGFSTLGTWLTRNIGAPWPIWHKETFCAYNGCQLTRKRELHHLALCK